MRKSSTTPNEGEYKGILDAFEKIYNQEGGLSAFYSGIVQDTGKSIADSFLFFLFYNFLRTNRLQKHGAETTTLPMFDELAVGMLAGACSKAFTTPISNIVTRKQTASMVSMRSDSEAKEPSVREIAKQIRSQKGLQGFWSGYSASLMLTLNPSITFFLYETFKRALLPRAKRDNPGATTTFLMAAISKAIASTITYPFSLAKTRAQVSSRAPVDQETKEDAKGVADNFEHIRTEAEAKETGREVKKVAKRSTVFDTVLKIYREEGMEGLYEGVWGEILKGFFSHGVTMLVKEAVHKLIIQAYFLILKALKKSPSPTELVHQASEKIQEASGKVGEQVQAGYQNLTQQAGNMVESSKEAIGAGTERAGVIRENITEVGKNAADYGTKNAGEALKSAREMVGGKVEEIGKDIKPVSQESKGGDD